MFLVNMHRDANVLYYGCCRSGNVLPLLINQDVEKLVLILICTMPGHKDVIQMLNCGPVPPDMIVGRLTSHTSVAESDVCIRSRNIQYITYHPMKQRDFYVIAGYLLNFFKYSTNTWSYNFTMHTALLN